MADASSTPSEARPGAPRAWTVLTTFTLAGPLILSFLCIVAMGIAGGGAILNLPQPLGGMAIYTLGISYFLLSPAFLLTAVLYLLASRTALGPRLPTALLAAIVAFPAVITSIYLTTMILPTVQGPWPPFFYVVGALILLTVGVCWYVTWGRVGKVIAIAVSITVALLLVDAFFVFGLKI